MDMNVETPMIDGLMIGLAIFRDMLSCLMFILDLTNLNCENQKSD